jgi:hypothetical protein
VCGVALRYAAKKNPRGFDRVAAKLFEHAVDAAENYRARFGAGGVAEKEQDNFPALIAKLESLAVMIGERKVAARRLIRAFLLRRSQ